MITRSVLVDFAEARIDSSGTTPAPLHPKKLQSLSPTVRGAVRAFYGAAKGCARGWLAYAFILFINHEFFHTPSNELSTMTKLCLEYTYITTECSSPDVNSGPLVWNLFTANAANKSIFQNDVVDVLERTATVRSASSVALGLTPPGLRAPLQCAGCRSR